MMRAILPAAILFAAAGLAAAAETDPRVEAFKSLCIPDRSNFAATKQRVEAAGWRAADGSEHPEFRALLERAKAVELDPGMGMSLASYRGEAGGRAIFIVVNEVTSEAIDLVSCYLYDFEAGEAIAQALFDPWLGEAPYQVLEAPSPMTGQTWDTPENLPRTWDVQNAFVAEGSAVIDQVGFSGVVIRITSVDPKDE